MKVSISEMFTRCCWSIASIGLLVFLLNPQVCQAQASQAQLYGIVTDAAGAAVAGANITVTNTATSVVTKTVSDAAGNYILPSLTPSSYTVTAEASGFDTDVLNGIILQVNQKARVDIKLNVGSVSTQVEVTAEALWSIAAAPASAQ